MGLFDKFKAGLQNTHDKLVHEMKRIVSRSPRLTGDSLDELQAALIAADFGAAMTEEIITAVRRSFETQGGSGQDVFAVASQVVAASLSSIAGGLHRDAGGPTVSARVAGTLPPMPVSALVEA